jgi:hypothetical protein
MAKEAAAYLPAFLRKFGHNGREILVPQAQQFGDCDKMNRYGNEYKWGDDERALRFCRLSELSDASAAASAI